MRVVLAFAAATLLAGSAQAATIVNGSFEAGSFSGAPFDVLGAGSPAITGWTIGGGGVDWIGSYWTASDGNRSLDMTAVEAGSVAQDVATVIGTRYTVSFDLAGNPGASGGPSIKSLDVTVNGGGLANYLFDATGRSTGSMGWTGQTYSFVASSTVSSIKFTSNNGFASGPALDNVSITSVPEAATWAMLIAGFGMVGVAARRRRSHVAA